MQLPEEKGSTENHKASPESSVEVLSHEYCITKFMNNYNNKMSLYNLYILLNTPNICRLCFNFKSLTSSTMDGDVKNTNFMLQN